MLPLSSLPFCQLEEEENKALRGGRVEKGKEPGCLKKQGNRGREPGADQEQLLRTSVGVKSAVLRTAAWSVPANTPSLDVI